MMPDSRSERHRAPWLRFPPGPARDGAYARWLLADLAHRRYGHVGTVRRALVALGYLPPMERGAPVGPAAEGGWG